MLIIILDVFWSTHHKWFLMMIMVMMMNGDQWRSRGGVGGQTPPRGFFPHKKCTSPSPPNHVPLLPKHRFLTKTPPLKIFWLRHCQKCQKWIQIIKNCKKLSILYYQELLKMWKIVKNWLKFVQNYSIICLKTGQKWLRLKIGWKPVINSWKLVQSGWKLFKNDQNCQKLLSVENLLIKVGNGSKLWSKTVENIIVKEC
jgi:hypothetical protein